MLRVFFVCAAALCCFSIAAVAQPEKKTETSKGKDDTGKTTPKEPSKSKTGENAGDPGKEMTKPKVPLDQMKLPNNAIIVVVEDLLKAGALVPKQWVVSFDEWLALQERVRTLEQKLKGERTLPSSCRLVGTLKGDFLIFRAEYVFATGAAKSIVPLGLQGGHLLEEGQLDQQPAILEFDKDDGFLARVDKEGNPHRLVLKFRVPVKKSAAGGLERSIDLGLPPAAGTILDLKLPTGVKEVRWNGTPEKPSPPGQWLIGLERAKALTLSWKEPPAATGNAPLAKVESQIKVDVDATHVNVTADLFLEDTGPKLDAWHLTLPPQAKVDAVKAPAGLTYTLEEKGASAVLRVLPTSDRWQVTISQRVPRPNPGVRVPIGPFVVVGEYLQKDITQRIGAFQQGVISVRNPAEANLGQRVVYTRSGEVTPIKNTETEAVFQFAAPPGPEKGKPPLAAKAPLELEWRIDKNQLRTAVEHHVKLRTTGQGYEIDVATQIQVSALFATIGAIDLKLPAPRPRGVALIGTASPALSFPGAVPWTGIWNTFGMASTIAHPDEFTVTDESGGTLKLVPQDAAGKTRVLLTRGAVKDVKLLVKNSFRIPSQVGHVRLELPRPLNTQDRRAKLSIQSDDRIELLHGPEGAEEPTPERHQFELSWEQAPASIDLAWRPYAREVVTQSIIDIDLHENTAQVQQTLQFPHDRAAFGSDVKNANVSLKVPAGIDKVITLSGGEIINHDRNRGLIWVRPIADADDAVDLRLQYDLPVAKKSLAVTPIWPAHSSREDVKVRVWAPAGVQVGVAADLVQRGAWKDFGTEPVREREHFPALVISSHGSNVPLTLQIEDAAAPSLAAFLADRALVQVRIADDGSQDCVARYLVRKINAPTIDVELPLPVPLLREFTVMLGKRQLSQVKSLDATGKLVRVQLHADFATLPAILEISYTIPAETLDRSSFWSTTLHGPIFRSQVVIGQVRWQLSTPAPLLAASFGRNVRAETHWNFQGWLFTPAPSNADWDAWLQGREATQAGPDVTFAFLSAGAQQDTVYHLPRSWWLMGCSGAFLILTLGCYFSPLPRWSVWLMLASVSAGLAVFALVFPAAWAGVAYGLQPGLVLCVVFVAIHRLLHERYRRQLVFLPGFARGKGGSTIVRTQIDTRPRPPSTVDATPEAVESATLKSPGTSSSS